MDAQRAMLDELMGSARNLTEEEKKKYRDPRWEDPKVCTYFLVRFCPHDLFVNTRSHLGHCPKIHDFKLKESFQKSKRYEECVPEYEERLFRFCDRLLFDLDRKVQRSRERLGEEIEDMAPTVITEKCEQLSVLEGRIKELLDQVEMLGEAGKVDEAEALMRKVEELNVQKTRLSELEENINKLLEQVEMLGEAGKVDEAEALMKKVDALNMDKVVLTKQPSDNIMYQQRKMAICEICGSLMTANDITERQESHVSGKQHLGYAMVRDFVTEFKTSNVKAVEERPPRKKEAEDLRQRDEYESRVSRRDGYGERERYHSERERSHEWSGRGCKDGGRGYQKYSHHMNERDWNHGRPGDRNDVPSRDRVRNRSRSRSPARHRHSGSRRLH